ncbi:MAG: hypothetical protein JWQ89_2854 [Devosia sp.]|uniref:HlyD family type I secretion periplasmic adaptor subunit n=1 Tax=Devosia sp. TaxID=1871048 RepID=UPI00262E7526|nr:HlyD family type I secretion periplasmic adaptor subunit [Devosia sp.]MDB5541127.1 hypothetical protein [Devosia sp.]
MASETLETSAAASLGRHGLVGFAVVLAVAGGLGLWAATTQIAGAVVAPGIVVVEDGSKRIQHQEGGIVSEILVRNGDAVREGQLLLRLDGTAVSASRDVVRAQLDNAFAARARLLAEASGATAMERPSASGWSPGPDFDKAFDTQSRLLQARRTSLLGQKSRLAEQTAQLEEQVAGLQAQQAALTDELAILSGEWRGLEQLLAGGLTDSARVNANRRQRTTIEGSIAKLATDIAGVRAAIAERALASAQVEDDFRSGVLEDLQALEVNIAELLQQKITADDRLRRLEVRAPRSGIIHQSIVQTIGGVVAPGEALMLVVPANDQLLVDVHVNPADVDDISTGQDVLVRFTGLDAPTTPELHGSVWSVSPATARDPLTGAVYYEVRIAVPEAERRRLGGATRLMPGMPAEAFLETDTRTVLAYLAKPLMDQVLHSFRED